jgi:hypothetical protein
MVDKFIAGAQLDAQIIKAYKAGLPIARFPLWHAPNVPTFFGALVKAKLEGVEFLRENVITQDDGKTIALVWVTGSVVASAAISQDPEHAPDVATGLAFRNAISRLFYDQRVWVGKDKL